MPNKGEINESKNTISFQGKLIEDEDKFVESLNLTPEKILEDIENVRNVEGFPIGDIEDILELSDPPYFTAYPNPYIKDFIEFYGTPYNEETDDYDVEPYISDVSEGKSSAIYLAQSYHSKIPSEAINKFVGHYCKKNDLILDLFSGSGTTGIAAQEAGVNAILNDISPAASFLSFYYNTEIEIDEYEFIKLVLKEEMDKYREEIYSFDKGIYRTIYWSQMFRCPSCNLEIDFWDIGIDENTRKYLQKMKNCPKCNIELDKNILKTEYENNIPKYVPVKKIYAPHNRKGLDNEDIDKSDLKNINKFENVNIPYWYPIYKINKGDKLNEFLGKNYSSIDLIYTKRNLYALSVLLELIKKVENKNIRNYLYYGFLNTAWHGTLMRRYNPGGGDRPLMGAYYVSSTPAEANVFDLFSKKMEALQRLIEYKNHYTNILCTTQSSSNLLQIPDNSIDYIFTDPPFGSSVNYVELNFLSECWLKTFTDNRNEVIINRTQNKTIEDFKNLIYICLKEAFRVLKPNRWITIVFHNSKAEIWRVLRESIFKSGFVIAQVATMNRGQKSINQLTAPGAVKNDLIINAYKPPNKFCNSFIKKAGLNMETKFIRMHLNKLPIDSNIERTKEMLYSRILAQYFQHGLEFRLDASEFYDILENNFEERNGHWFNFDQISKYEKKLEITKKIKDEDLKQAVLGIYDEKGAIIWLVQFLQAPKTYDEIFIEFSKNLMTSQDKIPELKIILDENFVTEGGKYRLPSELERKEKEEIRDKRLMKEFNGILEQAQGTRKIKEVRKEALKHGLIKLFKEKNVEKIKLLANKVNRKIIDSDDDVSAIIDWALYK